MNYTSIENVKNYVLLTIEESYEPTIEKFIESMSRLMDQLANRKLVNEDTGSENDEIKYYDGNDNEYITIEDCLSITKVQVGSYYGDNMTDYLEYITYPKIAPFRKIISKRGYFPCGIQNVAVTGKFGLFSELPADIEWACTVLVSGIIINQTLPTQAKTSERIGNYNVSYRSDKELSDFARAMDIINSYKKIEI